MFNTVVGERIIYVLLNFNGILYVSLLLFLTVR